MGVGVGMCVCTCVCVCVCVCVSEPPTFHLIFSYYTPINATFFKPFPYVHGYTLYHMHEKGWGWMLSNQ